MLRIVFGSALLLFAFDAVACQCGTQPSIHESLSSTAIFEGTLVDKRVVFGTQYGEIFPAVEYEFAVLRAWKGVSSPTVRLLGGYSNCASHFFGNERYLVFVSPHSEKPGALSSSRCSRTRLVSAGTDDIRALGTARISFPDGSDLRSSLPIFRMVRAYAIAAIAGFVHAIRVPSDSLDYLGLAPFFAASLGVCAFVASFIVFRRRRKTALLLALCFVLLAVVSAALVGAAVLRNPFFDSFVQWHASDSVG